MSGISYSSVATHLVVNCAEHHATTQRNGATRAALDSGKIRRRHKPSQLPRHQAGKVDGDVVVVFCADRLQPDGQTGFRWAVADRRKNPTGVVSTVDPGSRRL